MEPGKIASPHISMNMHINHFNSNILENYAPNRAQPKQLARHGVAVNADAHGPIELASPDTINSQAGVREDVSYKTRTLMQRMTMPGNKRIQLKKRSPSKKSSGASKASSFTDEDVEDIDDEDKFLSLVSDTLEMLKENNGRDGQKEIEEMLSKEFDPLQHYHVLYEAIEKLENDVHFKGRKISLKNSLNAMMSNLMDKYPHELRRALQETDDLVGSIEAMSGDESGVSIRNLRFLIGAKKKGNFDSPLTPLIMLKALIKNFGKDKCVHAMNSLRSRMMSGL